MKLYLANSDEAICADCGEECIPTFQDNSFDYEYGSVKGTYSFGDDWVSCCNSEVISIFGGEWTPEFEEAWDE